eukprot:GILJ01001575.1.p1 GENE.GILJ01001575.1~~GILJ01001575.1.p1  ORF type:complete len:713 (-),score=111.33 GILJ01001575.1:157-2295(-)
MKRRYLLGLLFCSLLVADSALAVSERLRANQRTSSKSSTSLSSVRAFCDIEEAKEHRHYGSQTANLNPKWPFFQAIFQNDHHRAEHVDKADVSTLFSCLKKKLTPAAFDLKTFLVNAITSSRVVSTLGKLVVNAASERSVSAKMLLRNALPSKMFDALSPMISYLFEHQHVNPYCNKFMRRQRDTNSIVKILLAPYETDVVVPAVFREAVERIFKTCVNEMLMADCEQPDADTEFSLANLVGLLENEDPILAHSAKIISKEGRRRKVSEGEMWILGELSTLLEAWVTETKVDLDQLARNDFWDGLMSKMDMIAKTDVPDVLLFPPRLEPLPVSTVLQTDLKELCTCEALEARVAWNTLHLLPQIGVTLGPLSLVTQKTVPVRDPVTDLDEADPELENVAMQAQPEAVSIEDEEVDEPEPEKADDAEEQEDQEEQDDVEEEEEERPKSETFLMSKSAPTARMFEAMGGVTLEHLARMGRQEQMVDIGAKDPAAGFRLLVEHANELRLRTTLQAEQECQLKHPDASKGEQAACVTEMADGSKVKGALVGIPIIQNLWANIVAQDERIAKSEVYKRNYAKKLKWFLVLNIAWAVWHQIESASHVQNKHLHNHNVVLGILTTIMSVLSDYEWDTKLFKTKSSPKNPIFPQWLVAIYSIWNYNLFETNFSAGKRWDMLTLALAFPIVQSIANHGDVDHWVNYRRDHLLHTLFDVFDK